VLTPYLSPHDLFLQPNQLATCSSRLLCLPCSVEAPCAFIAYHRRLTSDAIVYEWTVHGEVLQAYRSSSNTTTPSSASDHAPYNSLRPAACNRLSTSQLLSLVLHSSWLSAPTPLAGRRSSRLPCLLPPSRTAPTSASLKIRIVTAAC